MAEKKTADKEKNLEEAMSEIQEIISKMEKADCTLENSFELYSEGVKLLKFCNDSIDKVEQELTILEEEQ